MRTSSDPRRAAFTLIELLVVVAIIALLISILLPSLTCAREKARSAKCGVQLRNIGVGLAAYFSENNDWIPGVNTTGVEVAMAMRSADALRRPGLPVQTFDWLSPILKHSTELGDTRAKRWQTIINEYGCPSFEGWLVDELWGSALDQVDFEEMDFAPLSYLMPAHFQLWGRGFGTSHLIAAGLDPFGRPIKVYAKVAANIFTVKHLGRYQSRLDKLGPPSRKIAAADGTRFLRADGVLDCDISPAPTFFGSFTSNGAWWGGAQAYGVRSGSANWDGTPVGHDAKYPYAQGKNMLLSYRHGCGTGNNIPQGVRDNTGAINALFFDGHVAALEDRPSREIEFWYPSGAEVGKPGEGLTDVPGNFVVP